MIRKKICEILQHQPNSQEIAELHTLKDEEIDFTDMPKLNQDFWEKAMTPAQFRAYRKELKENQDSMPT